MRNETLRSETETDTETFFETLHKSARYVFQDYNEVEQFSSLIKAERCESI